VLHTVFIALHAASGVVAFAAGSVAILRRRSVPILDVHLGGLTGLFVFLAAALALDWPDLGTGLRSLFAALAALAIYMIGRGCRARRILRTHAGRRSMRYLDDVGFTLVALFDGFAIIAVLVNGGPGWAAAAVGVLGAAVGHRAIGRLKNRLAPAAAPQVASMSDQRRARAVLSATSTRRIDSAESAPR
jgi:small-conductance mechanosensitive channel